MEDDTIYLELFSDSQGDSLEQGALVLATQRKKLYVNNYILKHKGITIIYSKYLSREIVAFVVFDRETIDVFGWCSFSILFIFSESESFAGEAIVLGEISFLILLSLV